MNLPEARHLAPGERSRVRCAASLLSRPSLSPEQERLLARLAGGGPVPLLPGMLLLEPLFRHHLLLAGVDPGRVWSRERLAAPLPDFEDLARSWYRRLELLQELFATWAADNGPNPVRRVLLVKGAALAHHYPSPALRLMEDADLVVTPAQIPGALRGLRSCGWQRTAVGWNHPSGFRLDLAVPETDLARLLWANSEPSGAHANEGIDIREPDPSDHLVLIAAHAARNRGLRIWRDVCDARLLSDHLHADPERARQTANRTGCEDLLAALLDASGAEKAPGNPLARHYRAMAVSPLSPFGFNAVASLLDAPRGLARRGKGAGTPDASERDAAFGMIPAVGLTRQKLKLRWALRLARTGELRRVVDLVRASRPAFAAGKVFRDAPSGRFNTP